MKKTRKKKKKKRGKKNPGLCTLDWVAFGRRSIMGIPDSEQGQGLGVCASVPDYRHFLELLRRPGARIPRRLRNRRRGVGRSKPVA
jgi:hypothetical protein